MKVFPDRVLEQHLAVIGKTGSGKTSTAKLAIEQAVAAGARVCVLDPIKSDWWGLTSSVCGKRPGLPFHILGGPRGHVPLHAQAGAAIGEIVANGQLPLSILDMADFEMGGLQKFFIEFAPVLLRKMRGVLYLVVEEAHEFAPKERAGFGNENMAIHFAKKLAVAGRSRGIRIIIATQRTQSLHNAMLGSCDTLIAHRLTAPADQEPVVKWLKANLPPERARAVASSLQSLKTGEAWVCSGELGLFERIQFPRISTYDNTATPTNDVAKIEVKTAPVDHDHLRAIIGTAVEEANANDPTELKRQILDLRKQLSAKASVSAVPAPPTEIKVPDVALLKRLTDRIDEVQASLNEIRAPLNTQIEKLERIRGDIGFTGATINRTMIELSKTPQRFASGGARPILAVAARPPVPLTSSAPAGGFNGKLPKAETALLLAMNSRHPRPCSRAQLSILSGYSSTSSSFANAIGALRSGGYVTGPGDAMSMTELGISSAPPVMAPQTVEEIQQRWLQKLPRAESAMLQFLISIYPESCDKGALSNATGYSTTSSSFANAIGALRTLELVTRGNAIQATSILFEL